MARTFESVKREIGEHPENHIHQEPAKLTACCTIEDRLHIDLLDAHDRAKRQIFDS